VIENIRNIKVIRPLLDVNRKEIEEYCETENLRPQEDKTNNEAIYNRNKIRLELLPIIEKEYNENIVLTLNRLAETAREDKKYFAEESKRVFEELLCVDEKKEKNGVEENIKARQKLSLKKRELSQLQPAIRHRVIRLALESIGLTEDIERVHIQKADELLAKNVSNKVAEFPHGYIMELRKEKAVFLNTGRKNDV
ncbi:MAG: ATP-binding protein, partial [Anaerovoracaceae bacterium]